MSFIHNFTHQSCQWQEGQYILWWQRDGSHLIDQAICPATSILAPTIGLGPNSVCLTKGKRNWNRYPSTHCLQTYRDFLLSHKAYWVCATDTDRGYSCCFHCLEGIFWNPPPPRKKPTEPSSQAEARERERSSRHTDRQRWAREQEMGWARE